MLFYRKKTEIEIFVANYKHLDYNGIIIIKKEKLL